ncbi:hypothetical protein AMECASPLE_021419 [Ameca splendens]|uniref:Uncharacterized protein n=1 Tax=Ameca splendens TaxID=208324 RepID=A0ABV0XGJ5_9TELE
MVNCERKSGAVVRLAGLLICVLSLLSLIDMGETSLDELLEISPEKFQEILNVAVRKKKAEQSRDEAISRLLDEARSLTNKEQLEIFKQNLQKAVDEAFRLKTEDKLGMAIVSTLLSDKLLQLQPVKEMFKFDPLVTQLLHLTESLIGKVLAYILQKEKLYAGDAGDTERNLNRRSNAQMDLHTEL